MVAFEAVASDRELLQAWRAGDGHAGSILFERHFSSVYRFFCNKVGGDIDDLVQQTFLACVEGASRFRDDSSFRTFLFSIARHKLYDHLRAAVKRRGGREENVGVSSLHDLGLAPPDLVARHQEQRLLLQALRRLPMPMQMLLELSYWEGFTDTALAEIMEIPSGTLKSRLRKARQELEAQLATLAHSPQLLASTMGDLELWAERIRMQLGRGD